MADDTISTNDNALDWRIRLDEADDGMAACSHAAEAALGRAAGELDGMLTDLAWLVADLTRATDPRVVAVVSKLRSHLDVFAGGIERAIEDLSAIDDDARKAAE